MFGIETRTRMRELLEQGLSKASAARVLGISRRTIYNWIEAGELERDPDDMVVQYGPRATRPTKIDPYKIHIDRRLADYPQLSAARLFREVQAEGYPGGYGQVKRYVRDVRQGGPEGAVAGLKRRVAGPRQARSASGATGVRLAGKSPPASTRPGRTSPCFASS